MGEFDAVWLFTVAWDQERGLPAPILRLFRHRSTVEPGLAVRQTDRGHSTYYVKAVESYVQRYHPDRHDIVASATPEGGEGR